MKLQDYLDEIVQWLKQKVVAAGAKGLIVGVSGGIDSAVVANLAKKACGHKVLALILPCNSNPNDVIDATLVCETANIDYQIVSLDETYATFQASLSKTLILDQDQHATQLALANTKARLRMTTLYALGQALGYLVVGTDNWPEWHTGYFTKYGDGGVDLVPIVHLTKGEVKEAGKLLGVPEKIILRKPTAGLIANVYDEDELQVSYTEIDAYLLGGKISDKDQKRIEELHRISAHKRELAQAPAPFIRD